MAAAASASASAPAAPAARPAMVPGGRIQLVIGPMFSGKSSELLRRMRRYEHAKKPCLLVKYAKDTRYSDDCVSTHDRVMQKAVSAERLMSVMPLVEDMAVVGVDEGQFFPDLLEFCNLVANMGKVVIVAALDGTFAAEPFGQVCSLIPFCSKVNKLCAVCSRCGEDAEFSKRLSADTSVELIGGSDTYAPMCRSCFLDMPVLATHECVCRASPRPVGLTLPARAVAKTPPVPPTPESLAGCRSGEDRAPSSASSADSLKAAREAEEKAKVSCELDFSELAADGGRVTVGHSVGRDL